MCPLRGKLIPQAPIMTHDELLSSATRLPPPTPEAAKEYAQHVATLAERVSKALEARTDLDTLIGPGNRDMMRDNHRNHALFMASLFANWSPTVLVETVTWVFRAYRAHGFHLTYWSAQLNIWLAVMPDVLTGATVTEITPVYHWLLVNLPAFTALSETSSDLPSAK